MTQELATIRASIDRLNKLLRQAAGGYHENLLIRVVDDRVETLMQTNGRTVVSYCTFEESYFDAVDGECEAILPVGDGDQKGVLDYLEFAGSGTVEVTLEGDGTDGRHAPLATRFQAEGALNVSLRLPSSGDDLDAVPWDHPPRWTSTEEYASKRCLTDDGHLPEDEDEWVTGSTVIETSASVIKQQIIEPADFADGVNSYPISTEDGEFVLDIAGSQQDDEIWGVVNSEKVEGPDVSREFGDGFKEVFQAIEGPIRIQTAPDGGDGVAPPMTAVQDHLGDRTIRHLIGALGE